MKFGTQIHVPHGMNYNIFDDLFNFLISFYDQIHTKQMVFPSASAVLFVKY